ncbi:MAG: RNA 2',3'-cyclic phosphodiesterase [Candidatus Omnitrophota bacterium]|jgi:2'-5' RNA ligase
MRTFIAIELPKEIKDALSQLQAKLKTTAADVKWVDPQNIHLTLKFLGERDDKKIEKITRALEEVTRQKSSFTIVISSLGAFPNISSPRVIWAGIDKGDNETREIAGELEEKIARLGIPKEDRPFSSHITIGRTRSSLNREKLVQGLEKSADYFGKNKLEFNAGKITLFKSTLTPKGPVYAVLKEASLKTA